MDFIWHKVSDEEKKEIQREAKRIMDSFSSKLEKIKVKDESLVEREIQEREESANLSGKKTDEDFKKRILKNAPNKNDDFIISEKGSW